MNISLKNKMIDVQTKRFKCNYNFKCINPGFRKYKIGINEYINDS